MSNSTKGVKNPAAKRVMVAVESKSQNQGGGTGKCHGGNGGKIQAGSGGTIMEKTAHGKELKPALKGEAAPVAGSVKAGEEPLPPYRFKTVDGQMLPSYDVGSDEGFDLAAKAAERATGAKDFMLAHSLMQKAIGVVADFKPGNEVKINAVTACMTEMSPRDVMEGMLVSQMIACYEQSMHYMGRAARSATEEIAEKNLNMATKLQRTYAAQMEALDRHRRKGTQKVIVEHLHVNEGGQAIVAGSIERGGSRGDG